MTEIPTSLTGLEITDDIAARQYLHEKFDVNVCIEAGAGTGKTTTIIDRVVTAFERGIASPEGLVLMTFTEAAAAELERRVRELLLRRIRTSEDGHVVERLRYALEHLPEARIGTIHSVAENILHTYAREAGLPGSFSIIPPLEYSRYVQSAFEMWVETVQSDPQGREFLILADAFGLTRIRTQELLTELLDAYDVVTPGTRIPSVQGVQDALREGADHIAALAREALSTFGTPPEGHPSARVLSAIADELEIYDATDPRGAAAYLRGWLTLPVGGSDLGNQKEWIAGSGDPAAFREGKRALGLIREAVLECIADCGNELVAQLMNALAYHVKECALSRQEEGTATFHDLLVWTRDLLRTQREVREELHTACRMIIIDEFQDTDPIQVDIVLLLAGAGESLENDVLPPGRLTIVGDPKQSIYRFRDADIRMFTRVRDRILSGGGTLCTLTANFRSHKALLDVVNEHFSLAMKEDMGGITYRPLLATRDAPDAPHCSARFIGDAFAGNVADRVEAEAEEIVRVIRELQAVDATFQLGECCIIVDTRTHLYPLQKLLDDNGIPSLTASGALVLRTSDLRDILQVLRAVAEPGNVRAVVGTLKNHVFACSDAELLAWHAQQGTWEYRHLPHELHTDDAVGHALQMLCILHSRCAGLSVDAQIEVILQTCMLASDAALHRNALDRKRRYAWLVRMAREFSRERTVATLAGFVDLLEEIVRKSSRDALPLVTGPDVDAVRIMTVHEAKGLEFPTVILAGMQDPHKARTPAVRVLVDRTEGRYAVGVSSGLSGTDRNAKLWFTTEKFNELDASMRRADEEEAVRLLYVAMTRPRDRLVVSMFRTSQPERRLDLTLTVASSTETVSGNGNEEAAVQAEDVEVEAPLTNAKQDDHMHLLSELKRAFEHSTYQLSRALSRPTSQAITTLIHAGDTFHERASNSVPVTGRGRGFGTFVHGCIRAVDLSAPESIPGVISRKLVFEPEYQSEEQIVRNMIEWTSRQYGSRPHVQRWHEVPVVGVVRDVHLHGVIDMVLEEDGEYVVVDFKTDIPGPDRSLREMSYRLQLGLYAVLLEEATGRTVRRGEIAYLADGNVVPLSRDELKSVTTERSLELNSLSLRLDGERTGN
ncbi:MAG: UvrD-helicase domain-containing protein [Candidatus Dormibacteria bacterium]